MQETYIARFNEYIGDGRFSVFKFYPPESEGGWDCDATYANGFQMPLRRGDIVTILESGPYGFRTNEITALVPR